MSFDTSRDDGSFAALTPGAMTGLVARTVALAFGRTVAIGGGDGFGGRKRVGGGDGFGGRKRVGVGDETLGAAEVTGSMGSGDVCSAAGSAEGGVPALPEPPAPAKPATRIERTAAPARERAAYQRACLTETHASERTNVEGSASDMMAW
jgi:hypothetical protein